jgi:hypothetical protein
MMKRMMAKVLKKEVNPKMKKQNRKETKRKKSKNSVLMK